MTAIDTSHDVSTAVVFVQLGDIPTVSFIYMIHTYYILHAYYYKHTTYYIVHTYYMELFKLSFNSIFNFNHCSQ